MEAGQTVDVSIEDVVDEIREQGKESGVGASQRRATPNDAKDALLQTVQDIIEAAKGKSPKEVNTDNS